MAPIANVDIRGILQTFASRRCISSWSSGSRVIHISRWISTHGYALNVNLDPAPFTEWITACGLEDAQFTTLARELGRPVSVREVLPPAVSALAEVFELEIVTEPAAALA